MTCEGMTSCSVVLSVVATNRTRWRRSSQGREGGTEWRDQHKTASSFIDFIPPLHNSFMGFGLLSATDAATSPPPAPLRLLRAAMIT